MVTLWVGFIVAVLVLITLDLTVFHRRDKAMTVKSALCWSAFWIALSLAFGGLIYYLYDHHVFGLGHAISRIHPKGLANGWDALSVFLIGYLLEQSLSVDNLFVMAVIFGYFGVPLKYQHRVLFWGIIGVLVMRGTLIGVGAGLLSQFTWIFYIFGVVLLYTAYKMLFGGDSEADPRNNPVLRFARRFFPVTPTFYGPKFVIRQRDLNDAERTSIGIGATWVLTPLALTLIVVETTDLVFAVDSIPAIFAVTDDPFLVFTSNVCAVLGLRSLFFALAGILEKFEYLKYSLAVILALIGVKLLAHHWVSQVKGQNYIMLAVVIVLLAAGAGASMLMPSKPEVAAEPADGPAPEATPSASDNAPLA